MRLGCGVVRTWVGASEVRFGMNPTLFIGGVYNNSKIIITYNYNVIFEKVKHC
jgi:hypothetical protein